MAATEPTEVQRKEQEESLAAYERFLDEARQEPIKYVKHDNKSHDDEALYRLVAQHGMEWYGWYWLLVELLAGRKNHSYDVSDEVGWRRLTRDMSCMVDMSAEDCKLFIMELASMGLVSKEHLSEAQKVVIKRILTDAEKYAEEVAKKKLGAWKTNRKRMFG